MQLILFLLIQNLIIELYFLLKHAYTFLGLIEKSLDILINICILLFKIFDVSQLLQHVLLQLVVVLHAFEDFIFM